MFHDCEFQAFDLLSSNHWLRKRNDAWELKYPVEDASQPTASGTAIYNETSEEDEISKRMDAISTEIGQLVKLF